jgi:hypothetical protein
MLDEAAAEGLVVPGDGVEHLIQCQAIALQTVRVHDDLVLPREPTPRVHLAHAFHRSQARSDFPIVKRLALHRIGRLALDEVLIDLAECRRHGAEDGRDAHRQPPARLAQTLAHQLAREVDGNRVLEHDRHDRQTCFRDRSHLLSARHTHDRGFDGIGDALLHFDRG